MRARGNRNVAGIGRAGRYFARRARGIESFLREFGPTCVPRSGKRSCFRPAGLARRPCVVPAMERAITHTMPLSLFPNFLAESYVPRGVVVRLTVIGSVTSSDHFEECSAILDSSGHGSTWSTVDSRGIQPV